MSNTLNLFNLVLSKSILKETDQSSNSQKKWIFRMSSCFHGTCMYPLLFNFQIWPHNSSVQVFRYLSSLKNWYKWHNMLWVFLSFFPEEYWFSTPPLSDSPNSTVQFSICLQTQIILKVSRGILTVTNFLLRVSTKILTVKKPN